MPEPVSKNRRGYFRLRYPEADRPLLLFGSLSVHVVELSETGMRVLGEHEPLWPGADFAARLRFSDGVVIGVNGTVLRREAEVTVLKFRTGVPFRQMLGEQRRVLPKSDPVGD